MQEAFVGSWTQESHLSAEILDSLRDLNHRFLDLTAARTLDWVAGYVAPLSAAERAAGAGCLYVLFDLRFQDDGFWCSRLQTPGSWRVADEFVADDETVNFVRLALFYAWHVASSAGLKAQLVLGMNGATAAAFRRITVNRLPALVATEAVHLSARSSSFTTYWSALTDDTSRASPCAPRRAQVTRLPL